MDIALVQYKRFESIFITIKSVDKILVLSTLFTSISCILIIIKAFYVIEDKTFVLEIIPLRLLSSSNTAIGYFVSAAICIISFNKAS